MIYWCVVFAFVFYNNFSKTDHDQDYEYPESGGVPAVGFVSAHPVHEAKKRQNAVGNQTVAVSLQPESKQWVLVLVNILEFLVRVFEHPAGIHLGLGWQWRRRRREVTFENNRPLVWHYGRLNAAPQTSTKPDNESRRHLSAPCSQKR